MDMCRRHIRKSTRINFHKLYEFSGSWISNRGWYNHGKYTFANRYIVSKHDLNRDYYSDTSDNHN